VKNQTQSAGHLLSSAMPEKPAEAVRIKSVRESDGWWEIHREDGWTFGLAKSHGVTPRAGDMAQLWGGGIGGVIRGVAIAGQVAFYRTEAEDRQKHEEDSYGKDAADYLRKWDESGRAWSVAMGGFGPGYEQALQLAMFEALRIELDPDATLDHESFGANERVRHLGLSGAQAGAAMALARAIAAKGPIATIKGVDEDRRIQVSANAPSLAVIDRAIASELANATPQVPA
jgi:hypothetical protein